MTRDETIALLLRGSEAWNAWANSLLAERSEMESQGTWIVLKNQKGETRPGNEMTAAWLSRARADFTGCHFENGEVTAQERSNPNWSKGEVAIVLDNFLFPGDAIFDGASFVGSASFASVTFWEQARFRHVSFGGPADFENVTFSGSSEFFGSSFFRAARFIRATFANFASFENASFGGVATFQEASFLASLHFEAVTFSGDAIFDGATFQGDTSFRRTVFRGVAVFRSITAAKEFDFTEAFFGEVPDFLGSTFLTAPRMARLRFGSRWRKQTSIWWLPRRWLGAIRNYFGRKSEDITARFRALKRLSIQANDKDSERRWLSAEVKSARFVSDWPVPLPPWSGGGWRSFLRFWFGLIYEILSDFGNSILRPLFWWCLVATVAAVYYYGQSPDVLAERHRLQTGGSSIYEAYWETTVKGAQGCYSPEPVDGEKIYITGMSRVLRTQTNALREAIQLSIRNGFIVLDVNGDAAHRMYGCLYGIERYGDNPVAIVPTTVSYASMIQKLIAAILFFMLGLSRRKLFEGRD